MIDRIPSGFHPFVIPFLVGMAFVLLYCFGAMIRILFELSWKDRNKFFLSLINPKIIYKNIKDILLNCLLHVPLWKRNKLFGYMHSSIAFGWFMLIVLGHLEVILFVPGRINLFYYPIFFNYFVAENDETLHGSLLFFLMDFFLLVVMSGIALAIARRVKNYMFGVKRMARPTFLNVVGLYSLWAIFPLRWLAESFTAHISGGSFLTVPANWLFRQFLGNELYMLPTWWAYSIALCIFMCVLPFTRYMHIPTEMLLIPMRNAGLKVRSSRKGFARVEVFSCPNCGVCIDACPMTVDREHVKDCTVYLTRQLRRNNDRRIKEISDKCLLCGKCEELCQVGVEGPKLRILERARRQYSVPFINPTTGLTTNVQRQMTEVVYFAGCMSHLTPTIPRAVCDILQKAEVDYTWLDKDGGLCCGRPMFTAGRINEAKTIVADLEQRILNSGARILLVSCPICYKMFREEYNLRHVKVMHYADYFNELMQKGRIKLEKSDLCYVYHDPCELGRGCGMYDQPRKLIGQAACISEAEHNREESICCGGSLGSLSLTFAQRENMTKAALQNLYTSRADAIVTACPLCQATFARYSDRPVRDLAEIVNDVII